MTTQNLLAPHSLPPRTRLPPASPTPAFALDPEAFMTTQNLLALHMWLVVNRLQPEDA
jgi:hypothetical protein